MLDFKAHYDNADYCGTSKVYAIDNNRDRFLVATPYGKFLWVNTEDCTLADKDSRISFITKLETVLMTSGSTCGNSLERTTSK